MLSGDQLLFQEFSSPDLEEGNPRFRGSRNPRKE